VWRGANAADPKFIVPFLALASATKSWIERIGELALTTATSGEMPIIAKPVKSLVASIWILR
jgi:hypothetical protein